jgi:hypothetical protein
MGSESKKGRLARFWEGLVRILKEDILRWNWHFMIAGVVMAIVSFCLFYIAHSLVGFIDKQPSTRYVNLSQDVSRVIALYYEDTFRILGFLFAFVLGSITIVMVVGLWFTGRSRAELSGEMGRFIEELKPKARELMNATIEAALATSLEQRTIREKIENYLADKLKDSLEKGDELRSYIHSAVLDYLGNPENMSAIVQRVDEETRNELKSRIRLIVERDAPSLLAGSYRSLLTAECRDAVGMYVKGLDDAFYVSVRDQSVVEAVNTIVARLASSPANAAQASLAEAMDRQLADNGYTREKLGALYERILTERIGLLLAERWQQADLDRKLVAAMAAGPRGYLQKSPTLRALIYLWHRTSNLWRRIVRRQ